MSVRARLCALSVVLESCSSLYSVCRPSLESWWLAGNVNNPPAWCGAASTLFMRGTWRPPPFLVKFFSGKRDQGGRDCVHGRDLIAESDTLCECFNNVDVSVPLWLTEPRDKSSRQRVCFLSSLLYASAFTYWNLVCLYFHRVES